MSYGNPHFADPEWLWLAIAGPVLLVLLQFYADRQRIRQLSSVAAPELLERMTRSHSPVRRTIKNGLLALAFFGIGIAMARPQWGEQAEKSQSLGEDVLFLLDCSKSMLAGDVNPNRLVRAKLAVIDFVKRFGRGRVGLVAFAGQAFLQCPLTFDYDAFQDAVMTVDERTIPVPGTDVGRALHEGYMAIEKNERRKIMVLLSDGEDLEKSGIERAKWLATKDVLVFAVGVGTPSGTAIQIVNAQGVREPMRDEKGKIVESQLDEKTLSAIAEATHGSYQPLGALGEGLNRVRLALETPGGIAHPSRARTMGVDRFHIPLAIVLVLLVWESLMGTRRRRFPSQTAAAILVPLIWALSVADVRSANDAIGVGPEPDNRQIPRESYNEGTRLLRERKLREAEGLLQAAVASNNDKLQPSALYNLGYVRFRSGQEALKEASKPGAAQARQARAANQTDTAVKVADAALAGDDVMAIVQAYRMGRGVRKELNKALEAVQRAMDEHGAILQRWQRASADCRSALELRPDYLDAKLNAKIIDRHIAALVDVLKPMQMSMLGGQQKKEELQQRLDALGKRLPNGEKKGGEDDEDEDGEDKGQKPKDKEELRRQDGVEMALTPEEAMRLLDALKLDLSRKLSMGEQQTRRSGDKKGRDW